ncbi:MAG: RluA family pseudouridine synthase [Sphaerochaeta sp.]|jgi:23S rRNA pseudouridine1911/1915/1917 synthase|nr:RluA family pseudouridine synthase [Sphaerochaeta sp.]MDX9915292.1 RluA family pseudouridine synthase [Sphaerochaeta sp.]
MDIKDRILYEDNHLIIVNKEVGELSQGDQSGDTTLVDDIKAYLKRAYNKPGNVYLGVVHRLDRPTSGAIVYAKTEKALSRLNALFRLDTVEKSYWAVVDKVPPKEHGVLEHYLIKDAKSNKSRAVSKNRSGAKLARLTYTLIAASTNYYLLEVTLETGRHHQIRAQLEAIGLSIKGDLKYGSRRSNPDGGICLHARSLSFIHPVRGERISVTAPIPTDGVWQAFGGQ